MKMDGDVWTLTTNLISELQLHRSQRGPVSLHPLEDVFIPVRKDLSAVGIDAYGIARHEYMPTREKPAYIVIDAGRDDVDRRVLYCHEIGHFLHGHRPSLENLWFGEWFYDLDEIQATEVASLLLIPIDEMISGDPVADIAARCEVPRELVELYPWPWKV